MSRHLAIAWVRTGGVSGRLRPLLAFYLAGLLLFGLDRAVFLLYNKNWVGHLTLTELFRCFRVGWIYDTAVLCYALAPAALAVMLVPQRGFASPRFRRICGLAAGALLTVFLLGCIWDLFFFSHYTGRFNYLAFSFPLFKPEVLGMIWNSFPVGWGLALAVLIGRIIYRAFQRVAWSRPAGAVGDGRVGRSALACGLTGLAVLGCLAPAHPVFEGQTSPPHISREHVVNCASVNCVYTFSEALADHLGQILADPRKYGFTDPPTAFAQARRLLGQPGQTFVEQPGNPLVRVGGGQSPCTGIGEPGLSDRPRRDYNVVIVLMESMGSGYVSSLGGANWAPTLDAISRQGLMFDRLYAAGMRTTRGLMGVLCGFPDMPAPPITDNPRTQGRFISLSELLADRGYQTLFIHGGELKFNDVKTFLQRRGFARIVDRDDFDGYVGDLESRPQAKPGRSNWATHWGVDDQSMFLRANEELRAARRPFFACLLSLTNHMTYDVPHDAFDRTVRRDYPDLLAEMTEEERAVRYADWAVGDFLRRAAKEDYFRDTIFVLVADHCPSQRGCYPVDAGNFKIYALILGPSEAIGPPRRIPTVASQTDLGPTLLGLLGGPYEHCFFGRDLLRVAPDDGFALMLQNGALGFIRGDQLVSISPSLPGPAVKSFRIVGRELEDSPAGLDPAARQMAQDAKALFQSAHQLLVTDNYYVDRER